MRKSLVSGIIGIVALAALPSAANATNYILYLQGRGWGTWDNMQSASTSYTNHFLTFDGNKPLNDAGVISTINNAILNDCRGANTCVIHCYSAGCLRMQKAVSDLKAQGNTFPGLLWAEASASAAGGTKLAELSTKGGTKYLAKIIGQQEKVDFDLVVATARSHYQTDFGKTIYHIAGNKDICKSLLFLKICASTWIGGGATDGVVPMASAGGMSSSAAVTDYCNDSLKYAFHVKENRVTGVPCTGEPFDHFGMPNDGSKIITTVITTQTTSVVAAAWGDSDSSSACNNTVTTLNNGTQGSNCDDAFWDSAQDYSKRPDHTVVASNVTPGSSDTINYTNNGTCRGKCGGNAFNTSGAVVCACDSGCGSRGNCCSDYAAANCSVVNAQ
jgi:hypothetical protein